MKQPPTTIVDLSRLALSHGEGRRLDLPVRLDPIEMGGQTYAAAPEAVQARLDISRPSGGYAFRLRFPLRIDGPCMRCLAGATVETEVDAREVDQHDTEDEELRSPYVEDDELDIGRWAHDAAVLAAPAPRPMPPRLRRPLPGLRRVPERRRTLASMHTTQASTPAGTSSKT